MLMSPQLGKVLKAKKTGKHKTSKVIIVKISPPKNVKQTKQISHFQELAVGMVIPTAFGTYEVTNELAIGRCCEVYIGENVSTKLQDAVKVFIRTQHYQGALLRELKYLSKLSPNPHIVSPKGSLQYEGRDILIHELLSGTLKDILALHEGRPASVWFVTTLAKHLIRGISHMHRMGVIHGDLKPHNVMWSAQEEKFKLIDFGVSFGVAENLEHAVQSRAYQAPETVTWNQWVQAKNDAKPGYPCPPCPMKPGPAIDVWSVGCMVAEVLIGEKVFPLGWSGEDAEEALKKSLQKVTGKSDEFVSKAFLWLKKCLEVDSAKRCSGEDCEREPLVGGRERPSVFDLLVLPTTVVRVMNLNPLQMENDMTTEVVELVIGKASAVAGVPLKYMLNSKIGSLYLRYDRVQDSENAFQALKNGTVNGFSLIPTFYPREFFERGILC